MNDKSHSLNFNYVYFNFDWSWIKDKQIMHVGNKYIGSLYILDEDGDVIKAYGYELIN
jgi:hypothetical protein